MSKKKWQVAGFFGFNDVDRWRSKDFVRDMEDFGFETKTKANDFGIVVYLK